MFSVLDARLAELRTRYAEPHRSYHGQAHVDALLKGLTKEAVAMQYPAAAELAVWYHDATTTRRQPTMRIAAPHCCSAR